VAGTEPVLVTTEDIIAAVFQTTMLNASKWVEKESMATGFPCPVKVTVCGLVGSES